MRNPTFVTLCKFVLKRIQNVYTIVSSKVGRNIQPYGVLSKIIVFWNAISIEILCMSFFNIWHKDENQCNDIGQRKVRIPHNVKQVY